MVDVIQFNVYKGLKTTKTGIKTMTKTYIIAQITNSNKSGYNHIYKSCKRIDFAKRELAKLVAAKSHDIGIFEFKGQFGSIVRVA